MKKEYIYKRKAGGNLVTSVSRLADEDIGSAIKTHRQREEKLSEFPNDFWN